MDYLVQYNRRSYAMMMHMDRNYQIESELSRDAGDRPQKGTVKMGEYRFGLYVVCVLCGTAYFSCHDLVWPRALYHAT